VVVVLLALVQAETAAAPDVLRAAEALQVHTMHLVCCQAAGDGTGRCFFVYEKVCL
jgi:hypothetical protein